MGDENSSGVLMVLVSFKLIKEVEERSVKAMALYFSFSFGNEEQWPIRNILKAGFCVYL